MPAGEAGTAVVPLGASKPDSCRPPATTSVTEYGSLTQRTTTTPGPWLFRISESITLFEPGC
ncbi:hypothetical protein BEK98_38455 [Streptomyces diastatochromogenes]|uniref:Uncharacterized protein n=1 Tax=Streptomyces diastatochromogenes TaxID=42236 RepID=A0A233S0X1_STRDA|nr:hypothetical protein BEK98_38455 [Streptomyces diastatochromogenes]